MKKHIRTIFNLSVAIALLTLFAGPLQAQRPAFRMPARILSPEVLPDHKVVFRVYAKEVDTVTLSGDWMAGFGASEPMVKNDTGMFSIIVGPLEPELYSYTFTIDGVRVLDPNNPLVKRDGRRNESMFFVPGPGSYLYMEHDVAHGTLSKVWYPSPALDMNRRMYVYTPPGYASGSEKYPVLYLLHGGGGDEDAWTTLGRCCQIMDNLIAQKKARPMIVVMPNGNPGQAAAFPDAPDLPAREQQSMASMGQGLFEKSLVTDVIPYVESHYRTLKSRDDRAVAGLSMGGMQTMTLYGKYPETFGYYGVMSMGIVDMSRMGIQPEIDPDTQLENLKKAGYDLFWLSVGKDDFLYQAAQELKTALDKYGMKYTYRESTGGHTWTNWRIYLTELAPLLFTK